MAVNLTHKLTVTHVEWHTERRIDILNKYEFLYKLRPEGDAHPDATEITITDTGSEYEVLSDETTQAYRNTSTELYIPGGDYRAKILNSDGFLRLYKLETGEYAKHNFASLIGEYVDGQKITLEEGVYFIGDINTHSVANLNNYIYSYREYDVDVPEKTYTTNNIEEPIGFDDLQSTLKRHDYHGMGAEASLGNLEFYGDAFDVIKSAYDADIDTEVLYEVLAGEEIIYSGQIDLSTVSGKQGDYKSVSVKVGEIGAKTTFNNRVDNEIDIDLPKTIDGDVVEKPQWYDLYMPVKHLLYTNKLSQTADVSSNYQLRESIYIDEEIYEHYLFLRIGDNSISEFGSLENRIEANYYQTNAYTNAEPQYQAESGHSSKYGNGTIANIDIHLDIDLSISTFWTEFKGKLVATDGNKTIETEFITVQGRNNRITFDLSGEFPAVNQIWYFLKIYTHAKEGVITFKKGWYVKMTMFDKLPDTKVSAKMLLVHDALNVISQAISEKALSVKSDWYQTPESHWNPGIIGGGALKALTNGYKIRGLFSNEDNKRNMPISFKDMIESLSALDCIGWGFSKENDETFVRVERWDWFYKDEVILTLDSVNELQIDVEPDRIPTELKIGYKKYATQDQYNSIDSPHGTRTFINGIKALNKKITKESEFIADNYAIEETRRARTQVSETEETTYDENIFVFELVKTDDEYSIGHTSVNPEKVGNPDEFINAKLTPRHMASRWQDYIFATNNNTPFRFTTGEINYQAVFAVLPEETEADNITTHSLRPFVEDPSVPQAENADIANKHAKFKAEKITFSYPLTIEQYKSVLANPYGLIRLTEGNEIVAEGWIMDFKYKFEDGMADFTLLAKYVTQ